MVQEIRLVHAVVPDGGLDAHPRLQLLDGGTQVIQLLLVVPAPDTQGVRHLGIALQGVGVVILGEGAHLGRDLSGVEPEHVADHQGVGHSVGQVVEGTQLVGHGVAHSQKGIGEGHARHRGGIGHLLPGLRVAGAVVIGPGQVSEDHLEGPQGDAVGVVGGHHRGVGLQGVGDSVDARSGGEPLGGVHHHVRVHDGHGGHQLIVRQGVLHPGALVGDDGKGGHLRAGAGGGGDGDESGLLPHLGESVHPLADVHESHGHVHEIGLGVLVHHPHDLARVHGRAAADGDDAVRSEGPHPLRARLGTGQGGVGSHVIEHVIGDAHLVQLVGDRLSVTVCVQELVGDNERPLLVHHLPQGHGQAALLEIHLLRCPEPEHVLSPLRHGLDIQQMLDAHVLRHGVAAPGAAAQSQGWGQLEVVQVADASLGGGGVHQDAAGLHPLGEAVQLLPLSHRIEVDGGSVAVAAVGHQAVGLVQRVVKVLGPVHGQHGGELLVSELLRGLHAVHLADEDLGGLRRLNAGQFADAVGALAHDLIVQGAVDEDGLSDPVRLLSFQEVAAPGGKLRLHLVVDGVQDDDALLRGAHHAVVKGLGVDHRADRQGHIGGAVDDGGDVASAHAHGGLAGRIGRLHHAWSAGGQDQVHLRHQQAGELQAGHVDPSHDALRRAGGHRRLQHQPGGGDSASLGPGVGADDDAVAGLQGQQHLKDGGGGGVGGGDHRTDHPHRLQELLHAKGGVLLHHAAGLHVLIGIIDIF